MLAVTYKIRILWNFLPVLFNLWQHETLREPSYENPSYWSRAFNTGLLKLIVIIGFALFIE